MERPEGERSRTSRSSRPSGSARSRPSGSGSSGSPRRVRSRPTRSGSRRIANASAADDAGSSHCTSSTATRTTAASASMRGPPRTPSRSCAADELVAFRAEEGCGERALLNRRESPPRGVELGADEVRQRRVRELTSVSAARAWRTRMPRDSAWPIAATQTVVLPTPARPRRATPQARPRGRRKTSRRGRARHRGLERERASPSRLHDHFMDFVPKVEEPW